MIRNGFDGEEREDFEDREGGERSVSTDTDDASDDTVVASRSVPDDATVVVPRRENVHDDVLDSDATVVVARNADGNISGDPNLDSDLDPDVDPDVDPDATRAIERPPKPARTPASTRTPSTPPPAIPIIIETIDPRGVTGHSSSRNPAPPVVDPETSSLGRSKRDLPAGMFKSPLDPRRKARPSPFPQDAQTLPQRGVQQGLPVVYGARSSASGQGGGWTRLDERVGPPPVGAVVCDADRSEVPSIAKQNRRFRWLAIGGGSVVTVVVVGGLIGIAVLAFG